MGISQLAKYGIETVNVDIDFSASASEDVTISLDKPIKDVIRGRLWIDADPGAGFEQWATVTFYNKAAKAGTDAFYRTRTKMLYTELEVATTGSDANFTPDDHTGFSPDDLVIFLDDDEKYRILTVANTCVAEDNITAKSIDTGLSRVCEFSGFSLYNNESGTNVYLRIAWAAAQTVSLKMELLVQYRS